MGGNEILHEDRSLRIAARRNLSVAVWTATPEVDQLRTLFRATERLGKASRGAAILSVVVRGTPSFKQEVRDELVRSIKATTSTSLGTAHLILVDGFAGTAVRAFLSTAMLIARPVVPQRVFGQAPEALDWLHERLRAGATPWTPQELREAMDEALKGR